MVRNLILRWSGPLADDFAPMAEATNRVFRHFGKPELMLEEFRARFRLPFDSFFEECLPEVALDEIAPLFHDFFLERQQAIVLLPHALEFLHFCQATRRRVFLLGASNKACVTEQLTRLEVAPFFEKIYAGGMDQRNRIREILIDHQLQARETAFIGNMVDDVESARQGGVMSIAILTGNDSAGKLGAAAPDVMVRDLSALQALLESDWPNDAIRIEELEIFARVGVSEEERSAPQRLALSITLELRHRFNERGDVLAETIDYVTVCQSLRDFVRTRQDRLIETLAEATAKYLLERFEIARVELEFRKFVLPETKYVAVRISRPFSHVR